MTTMDFKDKSMNVGRPLRLCRIEGQRIHSNVCEVTPQDCSWVESPRTSDCAICSVLPAVTVHAGQIYKLCLLSKSHFGGWQENVRFYIGGRLILKVPAGGPLPSVARKS